MTDQHSGNDFWSRFDAIIFPLLALVVGGGYIVAILVNNNLSDVLNSPHALILLLLLASLIWFPLRMIYRSFMGGHQS